MNTDPLPIKTLDMLQHTSEIGKGTSAKSASAKSANNQISALGEWFQMP